MVNGIRTGDPRGFNKGRSSKFRVTSRVRQTPEEGRGTCRSKRWWNNNKDEDSSLKTLNGIIFCLKQFYVKIVQLNVKKVLFQAIQFSISTQFIFIWPIDKSLSGATTSGQSGPGSDVNEGVLRIPQSFSITGTSPWNCLVSYPGHAFGVVFPLCREAVGVLYNPSRLGKEILE